jgi:hypothetical protein
MSFFSLSDLCNKVIASQHTSRWIEEHEVRGSVVQLERSKRLQRQRESRLAENGPKAAPIELQPQVSVTSNALRIQRAGSGESIR